jgi:hypothetical protein
VSHEEINIRTDERPPGPRRGSKPRKRSPWVNLAIVVVALVIAAAILIPSIKQTDHSGEPRDAEPTLPRTGRLSDQSEPTLVPDPKNAAPPPAEQLVDDPTDTLLWASPTAGPPISLAYAPPGAQCFVYARPQALVAHPEGEKVLAALGPWGQSITEHVQTIAGAALNELDAVLASIIPAADRGFDVCLRVRLASPWNEAELASRLPDGNDADFGGQQYRVVAERAYFLPSSNDSENSAGSTLVICPAAMAEELIDSAGEPPPLTRNLEALVEHGDADRTATIIFSPKFFEASGSDLLVDAAEPLRDVLRRLVSNEATAVALSLDWGDDFFAELRAVPALNVPPRRLAAKLAERIEQAPDQIEELFLANPWHPHGRKVLARFPGMLRKLAGYARSGDHDRHALVRCYLPPIAGHNLLMAAELMLTQPHGDAPAATASSGLPSPESLSVEDRLARPTSLSFAKESLDRAVELLAADTGLDISIAGADLQLEGITRNQSLALDMRDQPAAAILVEILLRCNPDRTAEGPADPRQKLVYVVEPAEQGAPERIIVTTRTAAAQRQLPLPDVFVVPPP